MWDALPTQTLPQRGARPVKRLVALAQALSADGDPTRGTRRGRARSCTRVLDALRDRATPTSSTTAIEEVWAVTVKTITGRIGETGELTYTEFVERADDRAIRTGFETAKKAFGADIAQSLRQPPRRRDDDDDDDGLREAYVRASALATVKEVREKVDREADELAERLVRRAPRRDQGAARRAPAGVRGHPGDGDRAADAASCARPRTRIEDFVGRRRRRPESSPRRWRRCT